MQGQLFTQDFLLRGICDTPPFQTLDAATLARFRDALIAVYTPLRVDSTLNEAQTEQLVIERVLVELGWGGDYVPQDDDHRHASVTVNEDNLHNAAFGSAFTAEQKADPSVFPAPQYWVKQESVPEALRREWAIAFRDVARGTDVRTMIACIIPSTAAGNTLPLLLNDASKTPPQDACLLLANMNSIAFDFVARQKTQSTHLNWYIVEQLPVIAADRFEAQIGSVKIADFIREQVLHLSYTAHDLAPFARDLGHVNADGSVKPPFVWNDEDRRMRLAALDGLFMHLYGLSESDAAYILGTFPIVHEQDMAAFGRYRTKDDVLVQLRRIQQGSLAL